MATLSHLFSLKENPLFEKYTAPFFLSSPTKVAKLHHQKPKKRKKKEKKKKKAIRGGGGVRE
jgi:hypothetical protein